jgi:hypothetical protein
MSLLITANLNPARVVVNTKITDAGRETDLAFKTPPLPFHGLLTGSGFDLSGSVLFSFNCQDLVDSADSDAGQIGNLLSGDALHVQRNDKLAAFLIESTGGGYPKDAGVIFLNFFQKVGWQDIFSVGVFFHFTVFSFYTRIKFPNNLS